MPSPHVVSDIDYLAHSSSAASAEYTSLLRPLRGREPEGMWNLISIVKELFRKRDKNSIPLLRIITTECVNLDQMIHLWFLIKVSPLYNERGNFNQRQQNHHTPPVHQACASLLDEIVSLWRIACLNPIYLVEDKASFKELLTSWQKQSYDKIRKYCNSTPEKLHLLRRLDPEFFSAFQPAIDACQMTWIGYDFNSAISFKRICIDNLAVKINTHQNTISSSLTGVVDANDITPLEQNRQVKSDSSSSEGFCDNNLLVFDDNIKLSKQATELDDAFVDSDVIQSLDSITPSANDSLTQQQELTTINLSLSTNEHQRLEILFSRCEALHAHGYNEQACILAKILVDYLLSSYSNEKIYDDLMNCKNINCNSAINSNNNNNDAANKIKYITNFKSCILWRSVLLSTVLLENNNYYPLAFRIGIFALEMPRQPASTKALEVKLFNQEQDLVLLLKRILLTESELSILRDRAKKIREYLINNINFSKCKCNNTNYLPIMLASFLFDSLSNEKNSNCVDEQIGFEAAVSALSYKPNVNETQHAIYCEGIRRQKGDLAITLLLTYKDDQNRLLKIMDKILDKEIHVLFKSPINPFQPNLKRIQHHNLQKTDAVVAIPVIATTSVNTNINSNKQVSAIFSTSTASKTTTTLSTSSNPTSSTPMVAENLAKATASPTTIPATNIQPSTAVTTTSGKAINSLKYSAIDSLSSGWEESESEGPNNNSRLLESKIRCLNLNKQNNVNNNKKVLSNLDSSAPETTSSDNSPTINRKINWQQSSTATANFTISTTTTTTTAIIDTLKLQTTASTPKDDESDNDSGESLSSGNDKTNNNDENLISSSIGTVTGDINNTEGKKPVNMTTKPWVDDSFNEFTECADVCEKDADASNLPDITEQKDLNELFSSMLTTNPNDFLNFVTRVTCAASAVATSTTTTTQSNNKNSRSNRSKNKAPIYPNQPSEALAHFMFDFSKTVLRLL